jgi:hypothetical protein
MPRNVTPTTWLTTFWKTDRGLAIFLIFILAFTFLLPPFRSRIPTQWHIAEFFFVLLLLAGVVAVSHRRWHTVFMTTVVIIAVLVDVANLLVPSEALAVWSGAGTLVVLGLFCFVVLAQVFRSGPVTRDRILGAIAAYLLFGLTWASAYHLVALHIPDAFGGAAPRDSNSWSDWVYFSFVTLTTLGYGDITPVASPARSLALLEALTGQLYPAILLARLVSLELLSRPENPAP